MAPHQPIEVLLMRHVLISLLYATLLVGCASNQEYACSCSTDGDTIFEAEVCGTTNNAEDVEQSTSESIAADACEDGGNVGCSCSCELGEAPDEGNACINVE